MALQSSGAITLAQIQTEYGGANPISMSEYYRGGAYVTQNNGGIPTAGQISMSQFYGTQRAAEVVGTRIFQISSGTHVIGLSTTVYGPGAKTLIIIDHYQNGEGVPFSSVGSVTASLPLTLDRSMFTTASDETSWVGIYRVAVGTASSVTVTRGARVGGDCISRGYLVSSVLVPHFTNATAGGSSLAMSVSAGGITFLGTQSVFDSLSQPTNLTYAAGALGGSNEDWEGYRLNPTTGSVTHSWSITPNGGNSGGAAVSYSVT